MSTKSVAAALRCLLHRQGAVDCRQRQILHLSAHFLGFCSPRSVVFFVFAFFLHKAASRNRRRRPRGTSSRRRFLARVASFAACCASASSCTTRVKHTSFPEFVELRENFSIASITSPSALIASAVLLAIADDGSGPPAPSEFSLTECNHCGHRFSSFMACLGGRRLHAPSSTIT